MEQLCTRLTTVLALASTFSHVSYVHRHKLFTPWPPWALQENGESEKYNLPVQALYNPSTSSFLNENIKVKMFIGQPLQKM